MTAEIPEEDVLSVLRAGLSSDPTTNRPAGVEVHQDLAPAGGLPVTPPSYEGRLEIHKCHVNGEVRDVIELDSVGSSANRLEETLIELMAAGRYPLPVSTTTIEPGEGPPISISTLTAPHRLHDAWIRLSADPEDQEKRFAESELGQELSSSHMAALDPLLEVSAHDLLFGTWDSHRKGPRGQVRIGRALTTRVIGLDPLEQARIAARRDPLNLGEASDLPREAKKLSEQGLSSIPPQKHVPFDPDDPTGRSRTERIEGHRGGVSITEARFLGFLSFAALRRLGFERYDSVDVRVMLACLALYALILRSAAGWDLRAECALVPAGDLRFVMVDSRGERTPLQLSPGVAEQLFSEAADAVKINDRSVSLRATKALNDLVAKAIAAGADDS